LLREERSDEAIHPPESCCFPAARRMKEEALAKAFAREGGAVQTGA